MRPAVLALLGVVVLSNVAGNLALSWGMKHAPANASVMNALLQPAALAGILVLIAWTLLRMKLLEKADLSFILPVTAVGYVLNAVAGFALLHEQVSNRRWMGTLLIMAGAALTSITGAKSSSSAKDSVQAMTEKPVPVETHG